MAGTAASDGSELTKETRIPPDGALPERLTVREVVIPPWMVAGETATEERTGGNTDSVAEAEVMPYEAVILAVVIAARGNVVTVKAPELAPAGIVTEAGTCATSVFELARVTVTPADGAGAESETLPVEGKPPKTLAGTTETAVTPVEKIVRLAVFDTPRANAVIVTVVLAVTVPAWTLNGAAVAPAATRTDAGTDAAAGLELESETVMPPVGAAAVSVTEFPVVAVPSTTEVGFNRTLCKAAGPKTASPEFGSTISPDSSTASMLDPKTCCSVWRFVSFHRESGAPVRYHEVPLSARIAPYCLSAVKITWTSKG